MPYNGAITGSEHMEHVYYVYARALELEGRHPHDVGQWGVTNMRLLYLEGLPADLGQFAVPVAPDGTFEATPSGLHTAFRDIRCRYYRRVRSAAEAALLIHGGHGDRLTKACLPVYSGWVDPPEGIIPMPLPGETAAPDTHAVLLLKSLRLAGSVVDGEADARHFIFINSWGEKWGVGGHGVLPFAYYDTHVFEQWAIYVTQDLTGYRYKRLGADRGTWHARDEFDRKVYAFEVGDLAGDRLGWAYVLETDGALEVEELYVAPDARRNGIGSWLAGQVSALATAKGMPLRVWVSFADVAAESPLTAGALPCLARRLGVEFQPCPVRWAGYFATNERAGSATPVEPEHMPGRPKSTLGTLAAFATVAAGAGGPASNGLPSPPAAVATLSATSSGTPAETWADQNRRRAHLIRKKNWAGLNVEERAEYERLQAVAEALIDASLPPPLLTPAERALVDARAAR